jgi:uncharacterized protein YkwD
MKAATRLLLVFCAITAASCSAGRPRIAHETSPELSPLEREIVDELNSARTDPKVYAEYVAEWLPYYERKRRILPGQEPVWTTEGTKAVEEAVAFLDHQMPLGPLKSRVGLSKAAQDHVDNMGPAGAIGHMGFDDSESAERISRYGEWWGKIGEVICYGAFTARDIVIQWIVDDGVTSRAHRKTLFDPDFQFTGVAYGDHAQYGSMCVVTFAKTYIEAN